MSSDAAAVDAGGAGTWSGVYGIIRSTCLGGCHNDPGWNLDMSAEADAYQGLVVHGMANEPCGSGLRVKPGDSRGSVLYLKIAGASCFGTQMPLRLPPLSPEDIQTIASWIDAGAMRND
jgi:hypothetical protein